MRRDSALRWEVSRGGDLFPHLYGDMPLDAVISVVELLLGVAGRHVFPSGFEGNPNGADE